ncbi:hypothetical protein N9B45_00485 [bacterium]|nr:hypothetical protein [bacterium]MDA7905332.1 hypothetical protein [Mariniblastus sp.]MDA7924390.1 hypothetical protein [Mariniblastus sp.]MDB4368215.1 hypothetical protein [Mariniblastus sp.]MDC0293950.1 hypothetical protein [Mariniblastus sp.]|tara:strand:+ start:52 stop:405 length:354 start_codon:yes stop_codon:yes gene_type:complete
MATRQEVFDLIQKQMAQRAAVYNSAVAVQTKPVAKRFAASNKPTALNILASKIESSCLTVKEIGNRTRIETNVINQFLNGDEGALSGAETRRIKAVVETMHEMKTKAERVRSATQRR